MAQPNRGNGVVALWLLKRISDDIEATIRHVETLRRTYRDAPDLDAAWDRLNGMRCYVNDAWEAAEPPAAIN